MRPHAIVSLPKSRLLPVFLAFAAVALASTRFVWEWRSPLHFATVKSVLYWRDALTFIPAIILATAAVLMLPPSRRSLSVRRGFAVGLAVMTTVGCYTIARFGLLGLPHVADEASYLWQAQLLTQGRLWGPLGVVPHGTLIEFIGNFGPKRVSGFFLGSSLPLAVGQALGGVTVVDPILAGVLVLITYWAGRRLFDSRTALVGTVLFAVSPFVLFQGASFFGHVWTALLLVPAITMALSRRRRLEPVLVGFLIGGALLSRPVSAVVAAVVVAVCWVSDHQMARVNGARFAQAIVGGLAPLLLFLWIDRSQTGKFLFTAHRLLRPTESMQVSVGTIERAGLNIAGMTVDSTGLMLIGLVLLIPALRTRSRAALIIALWATLQLVAYSLYGSHGISYGPRYQFEITPLLVLVMGYGLTRVHITDERAMSLVGIAVVSTLLVLPGRLHVFHQRAEYLDLAPVEHQLQGQQAVVLVTDGPWKYPDPFYPAFVHNGVTPGQTAIVYVRDGPDEPCAVVAALPGRTVYRLDMVRKAQQPQGTGALQQLPGPFSSCE